MKTIRRESGNGYQLKKKERKYQRGERNGSTRDVRKLKKIEMLYGDVDGMTAWQLLRSTRVQEMSSPE